MAKHTIPYRIKQYDERLFTVRPRSMASNKRGEVCSFKLNIPKDETTNFEKLLKGDAERKSFKALTNTDATDGITYFIDFLVINVSYDIQERSEIMHTFGGKNAVYFYGEAPVIVTIQGILADDLDNDQYVAFMELYTKFLSGSSAAKEYCTVDFLTPSANFTGAFMSLSINQNAERDTDIGFTAQFLSKKFEFKSTDAFFRKDGVPSIIDLSNIVSRNDPDPTITQQEILANKMASISKGSVADREGGFTLAYGDSTEGADADENKPTYTISADTYTLGVDSPKPPEEESESLLDELGEWFEDVFEAGEELFDYLDPLMDILDTVTDFANDAIALVESIEAGIDGLLSEVITITEKVWGTIESIEDVITTISNFPAALDEMIKSAKYKATRASDEMATLGSGTVSPKRASKLISDTGNTLGSSRGTAQGAAAALMISRSSSIATLKLPVSPSLNPLNPDEIPAMIIGG